MRSLPLSPIEQLPGLAARLGVAPDNLLVLREDLIGLAAGGNKVRKAVAALTRAASDGVEHVVTTGAPQSNHARATAIVGAQLGLKVSLVLEGAAPHVATGNLLLEGFAGATITWAGDYDAAAIAEQIRLASPLPTMTIPFGGSDAAAVSVYADVGRQVARAVPNLRQVVVAVGSGATAAGLVVALGPDRVLGVDTGAVTDPRQTIAELINSADPNLSLDPARLRVDRSQLGGGYATIPDSVIDAVRAALADDGILFDVTYAGRALAGLVRGIRVGEVRTEQPLLLVHTGGTPGLFGHPELIYSTGSQ